MGWAGAVAFVVIELSREAQFLVAFGVGANVHGELLVLGGGEGDRWVLGIEGFGRLGVDDGWELAITVLVPAVEHAPVPDLEERGYLLDCCVSRGPDVGFIQGRPE